MKAIISLVKYQLEIYFRGSKFVMPFVVAVTFLYTLFSVKPVDMVNEFSVCCYLVFIIMVCVGFGTASSENVVMEQIQLLRAKSSGAYYMGKSLFLFILGVFMDVICLALPAALNLLNHGGLFTRPFTGFDVLNVFLLLCASSFTGGALGSMLHPRVLRDRKTATVLTLLFALLTVGRTALVRGMPIMKWIAWIIPPLDNITIQYGGESAFQWMKTGKIVLSLTLYGIVFSVIKSVICNKRKF